MNPTYGLEYVMFFGVPSNKLELIGGISHWRFPFRGRDEAEAHFQEWIETLRRWKQVESPTPITKSEKNWQVEVGGIRMQLYPRPINLDFPIDWRAFRAFLDTFNRRDYWPSQPEGLETGWDHWLDAGDVKLNLWSVFGALSARHGGKHSSRVDIALIPWAGHPERRWEFWDNKARSTLAFGSPVEARARLDYFMTEACRWEALPRANISQLADDIEMAEIGRFQLTRRGRLLLLDVAIDGRRHRDILTRWADSDCWDWGER